MKAVYSIMATIAMMLVQALADSDPDSDPFSGTNHWFCGVGGISCGKRSVDTVTEEMPITARFNDLKVGYCGLPGESCVTLKRSAEAVRDALSEHWANFDAPKTGLSAICNAPGGECDIAGQAIGNVSETAENAYHELVARNQNPVKRTTCNTSQLPGGQTWFCGAPGQSCGRKRSEAAVAMRKRDANSASAANTAESMAKALREIDPNFLISECNRPGNECDSLRKAHEAFHEAKREAVAIKKLEDPEAKRAYCATYGGCGRDTKRYLRYLRAGDPEGEAKLIEADCFAEEGECTLAQRSLDALELTLDEAIASIS